MVTEGHFKRKPKDNHDNSTISTKENTSNSSKPSMKDRKGATFADHSFMRLQELHLF
jgi:hypothetical protein